MAISVDEFTKTLRTLYYDDSRKQLDGSSLQQFQTNWLNIDNEVGFVSRSNKAMAFGDKSANNSIMTAKLYPSFSNESRTFSNGSTVDRRNIIYYSNISAKETARMEEELQILVEALPNGWNGAIVPDPDGTCYLLLSHFYGATSATKLSDISCTLGAPVFESETTISNNRSSASFNATQNHSVAQVLKIFVQGDGIKARQDADNNEVAFLTADSDCQATVTIISDGKTNTNTITLPKGKETRVYVENGEVTTGIKALKRNPFVASGTYTVSGVRVADNDKLPRGLYIQNGKKRIR